MCTSVAQVPASAGDRICQGGDGGRWISPGKGTGLVAAVVLNPTPLPGPDSVAILLHAVEAYPWVRGDAVVEGIGLGCSRTKRLFQLFCLLCSI